MKKIIFRLLIATMALVAISACNKEEYIPAKADLTSLRLSLTPDPGTIPATGRTFESAVVVARGIESSVDWNVSVDFAPDWVTVTKQSMTGSFTGTYGGDDRETSLQGIQVTVAPNETGARRTAFIRFTIADGGSISYTLTQTK